MSILNPIQTYHKFLVPDFVILEKTDSFNDGYRFPSEILDYG